MAVVCNLTAYEINNSTNVANNSTNIYVKLTATTSGKSYNNTSPSGSITINGTTYSFSKNIPKVTTTTLYEATHTIIHNTDGKKSVGISYSFNTEISAGTLTGNKTIELSTVPRTSSVTCADGNIESSTTININRASSSFTHTLTYNFLGLTGTIATKTSSTSIGWTIPTSFYAKIPTAKSGRGTITCETFTGNTSIGKSACQFNAFVVNSIPTVSATVVDTNTTTIELTGDANKLIKYYSNAKVTIVASAKNSATITSQKVICANKSSTNEISTLNAVENGSFNISCTDSRGLSAKTTISKTLINYIKLAFTQTNLSRISTTSNTINAVIKGNYFNSNFGKVANTLVLKWRWRIKNGTWSSYVTVTPTIKENTFNYSAKLGTNFSFEDEYEFEFLATDKLRNVVASKVVTRGLPIIDIGKNDVRINGNVYTGNNLIENDKDIWKQFAVQRSINGIQYEGRFGIGAVGSVALELKDLTNNVTKGRIDFNKNNQLINSITGDEYQTKAKNLYNNTSGTTGTVTLSETVANFKYLEIFYGDTANGLPYNFIRVYEPNGKNVNTSVLSQDSSNIRVNTRRLTLSGTTITPSNYQVNYFPGGSTYNVNEQKIYRVDGYK